MLVDRQLSVDTCGCELGHGRFSVEGEVVGMGDCEGKLSSLQSLKVGTLKGDDSFGGIVGDLCVLDGHIGDEIAAVEGGGGEILSGGADREVHLEFLTADVSVGVEIGNCNIGFNYAGGETWRSTVVDCCAVVAVLDVAGLVTTISIQKISIITKTQSCNSISTDIIAFGIS